MKQNSRAGGLPSNGWGEASSVNPSVLLLVDDNSGDVMLIRQTLREAKHPIGVVTAVDGEQAVGMLSDPEFRAGYS